MGANIETGGFLDLKKQFTFYASHHNNPVNIFIHLICIWNILWSALAMFHMLGPLAPAPSFLAGIPLLGGIPITLATLTTAVYVVCYILMEPFAGGIGALLVLGSPCGRQYSASISWPGFYSLSATGLRVGPLRFWIHGSRHSSLPHCSSFWRSSATSATANTSTMSV